MAEQDDPLESNVGKKAPEEETAGPGPNLEVTRRPYEVDEGDGYQYHVDFRDTSGKVVRTLPAPAWAHDLYLMYLAALHRAEAAEENGRHGLAPAETRRA